MNRLFAFFFLIIFLTGCVSNEVRISEAQRSSIQSAEKINVIFHGPIGPALQTAGDAVKFNFTFALAGWGTPGLQLMGENDIQDPLINIREKMIEQLSDQAQMTNLHSRSLVTRDVIFINFIYLFC